MLSLAKKHSKNIVAPVIAGGLIYSSEYIGISIKTASAAPILSEFFVLLFFSLLATREIKKKEKEAKEADENAKNHIEDEIKYFTGLLGKLDDPETREKTKDHITNLVSKRVELSESSSNKVKREDDEKNMNYMNAKREMINIREGIDSTLSKLSSKQDEGDNKNISNI